MPDDEQPPDDQARLVGDVLVFASAAALERAALDLEQRGVLSAGLAGDPPAVAALQLQLGLSDQVLPERHLVRAMPGAAGTVTLAFRDPFSAAMKLRDLAATVSAQPVDAAAIGIQLIEVAPVEVAPVELAPIELAPIELAPLEAATADSPVVEEPAPAIAAIDAALVEEVARVAALATAMAEVAPVEVAVPDSALVDEVSADDAAADIAFADDTAGDDAEEEIVVFEDAALADAASEVVVAAGAPADGDFQAAPSTEVTGEAAADGDFEAAPTAEVQVPPTEPGVVLLVENTLNFDSPAAVAGFVDELLEDGGVTVGALGTQLPQSGQVELGLSLAGQESPTVHPAVAMQVDDEKIELVFRDPDAVIADLRQLESGVHRA